MENVIVTTDMLRELLGSKVKVKKEKLAKLVCKIDGELIEFKNEKALKKFIWKERPETIIIYKLEGEAVVPFDLVISKDEDKEEGK